MKLLVLMLAAVSAAFAQTPPIQPDCPVRVFTFTGNGTSAAFNNIHFGCTNWVVTYEAIGFSSINLSLQAAPAATLAPSPETPGSFVNWAGTITNGVDPNTVSPGSGVTRYSDVTTAGNPGYYAAFVQLNLTAVMGGPGTVTVVMYGYKPGSSGGEGGGGGGGCTGTPAIPCVVDGPNAAGVAATTPPVLIAGQDGAPGLVRTIQTDTSGRPIVVGAAAAGAAIAGNPVQVAGNDGTDVRAIATDASGETIPSNVSTTAAAFGVSNTARVATGAAGAALVTRILPYQYNGSTLDSQFICNIQQAFSVTGTDVVIATHSGSTTTRLCHIEFSNSAAATVTIQEGTGTTCLSGTATMAGPLPSVATYAADFQPSAALRTQTPGDDVCLHFGSSITSGGVAIFTRY